MKKSTLLIILSVFVCSYLLSQENAKSKTVIHKEVEAYIQDVQAQLEIPGIALAIVKGDQVLHRQNYGYASLEHKVLISEASIFRVYSLSKLFTAVAIFQLIETEKLSLDDTISSYINDLPKAWRDIKIKHLLSHSSGLPDMTPIPDFKDLTEEESLAFLFTKQRDFDSGEKYSYNQTGFWILKKIIEKVTGEDFDSWILTNQFHDTNGTVLFSSDSRKIIENRTTPYFPFTTGSMTIDHPYLQGDYAHALNGLNLSLEAYLNWDSDFKKGKILSEKMKMKMWQTFPYTKSNYRFTYGWDKRMVNDVVSYGFSGSLVTAYRTFPNNNLSIIFLSNALNKFYNIENVINDLATIVLE